MFYVRSVDYIQYVWKNQLMDIFPYKNTSIIPKLKLIKIYFYFLLVLQEFWAHATFLTHQISIRLSLESGENEQSLFCQSPETESETWLRSKRLRGQLDVAVAAEAYALDFLELKKKFKALRYF